MFPKQKKQKLEESSTGSSRDADIGKNVKNASTSTVFDPHYFPIEVWNHVFHYVSFTDLKNLSLSCKSFYQTIGSLPDAMDRFVFSVSKTMEAEDQGELLKSSRNYRHIRLTTYIENDETKRNFQDFLKSQAQSVADLHLIHFPIYDCSDVFESMKNLEKLTFETAESEIFKADQNFVCPSLRKLVFTISDDISHTSFSNFIKKFPNIEEASVKMKVDMNLLKLIADNCANLKKITICCFDHTVLKDVTVPNLQELVIEELADDNSTWELDMKYFDAKNLEVLIIEDFHIEVTIQYLTYLLKNFKKLKHLDIEGYKLNEEDLCNLSEYFENFNALTIRNLPRFMRRFQQRLQQFPGLHFEFTVDENSEFFFD